MFAQRIIRPILATKGISPRVGINVAKSFRHYSNSSQQLKQILKQENEEAKTIPNELSNAHKDFIEASQFLTKKDEGKSTVELVKDLGDEKIQIFFDIDEVTDIPIDPELNEENGEFEFEDAVADIDSYLCSVKVLISKPDNTGIFLNLFLQNAEQSFMIDFINVKSDVAKFQKDIANGEYLSKFEYQGPRFSELDESIQVGFENYLDSKGIDQNLADYIIAYSEVQEEEEYRKWLDSLTNFF